MSEESDKLFKTLQAGIHWLYSPPPQSRGALMSHHGIYAKENFFTASLGACPRGFGGCPVISFENLRPYQDTEREQIPPETRAILRDAVERAAKASETRIIDSWGEGVDFMSFSLERTASPTVLQLVEKYSAGCSNKAHRHFAGSVFCDKGWFQEGHAMVVLPLGWR